MSNFTERRLWKPPWRRYPPSPTRESSHLAELLWTTSLGERIHYVDYLEQRVLFFSHDQVLVFDAEDGLVIRKSSLPGSEVQPSTTQYYKTLHHIAIDRHFQGHSEAKRSVVLINSGGDPVGAHGIPLWANILSVGDSIFILWIEHLTLRVDEITSKGERHSVFGGELGSAGKLIAGIGHHALFYSPKGLFAIDLRNFERKILPDNLEFHEDVKAVTYPWSDFVILRDSRGDVLLDTSLWKLFPLEERVLPQAFFCDRNEGHMAFQDESLFILCDDDGHKELAWFEEADGCHRIQTLNNYILLSSFFGITLISGYQRQLWPNISHAILCDGFQDNYLVLIDSGNHAYTYRLYPPLDISIVSGGHPLSQQDKL